MKQVADQLRGGRALVAMAVLAVVTALAIVGCGDSSDANGETTGSTDSGPTITKVALIKRGDAICQKTDERQASGLQAYEKENPGAVKKPGGIEKLIVEVALPPIAREIEELEALGAPAKDEAKMAAIIKGLERALRIAENNPTVISKFEGPFKAPGELAGKYGFEECARPL